MLSFAATGFRCVRVGASCCTQATAAAVRLTACVYVWQCVCRVGHGSKPGVSSTAVEAFEEPTIVGVAASDSNDPVVVARRRGTAPAR
jgi:hypothetical protein